MRIFARVLAFVHFAFACVATFLDDALDYVRPMVSPAFSLEADTARREVGALDASVAPSFAAFDARAASHALFVGDGFKLDAYGSPA